MPPSISTSTRRSSVVAAAVAQLDANDASFQVKIQHNQLPAPKLDLCIDTCLSQMSLYYKGEKTHYYQLAEGIKKILDVKLNELEDSDKRLQNIVQCSTGGGGGENSAEATSTEKRIDGTSWHVIVGSSFGSYVSHQNKNITLFSIGAVSFLIFKHC